MAPTPTIYWFRRDLRLADNQGFTAAASNGPVVPLFIWSPSGECEEPPPGAASRWWLHGSLEALQASLQARGSRLVLRIGESEPALLQVAQAVGANGVFCERLFDPRQVARDAALRTRLGRAGIEFRTFDGALLTSPERIRSRQGKPFRVFTPFWREARAAVVEAAPLPTPPKLLGPTQWPASVSLSALNLLPTSDWAGGLRAEWTPGEAGANERLGSFVEDLLRRYAGARDYPAERGTSRLSPHLHYGEVSVRSVWVAVKHATRAAGVDQGSFFDAYLRQLGWREFAQYVVFNYPHTPNEPLDESMRAFPWVDDEEGFRRWCNGLTGFPIVDAGMRELWHTGWMHNRVRMMVASFLVKDLLCDWRKGAAWFWDTLVDADLANNTLGWQWAAGCGADAAPYFRVFNPVVQGLKFDPRGAYVRRWVPELERLEDAWLHAPHTAPPLVLQQAGIALGRDYPAPLVDHAAARARALAALDRTRSRAPAAK